MIGPEGAAARVTTVLAERIPARLRLLEARLTLPAGTLANPAQVLDHERGPIGLEDWPAVYVLPRRLEQLRPVDTREDGADVYLGTYTITVLAWVRADDYVTTDALRKRYALAIREALLERKAIGPLEGTVPDLGPDDVAVDPTSIREDYSPVITDDAARTIAGVEVTVTVYVAEVLPGPAALGTADELDVLETHLPRPDDL